MTLDSPDQVLKFDGQSAKITTTKYLRHTSKVGAVPQTFVQDESCFLKLHKGHCATIL